MKPNCRMLFSSCARALRLSCLFPLSRLVRFANRGDITVVCQQCGFRVAKLRGFIRTLATLGLLLGVSVASANVEFTVNLEKERIQPGDQSLMVMVISNSGSTAESGLTVTLPYPSGLLSITEDIIEGPFDPAGSCSAISSQFNCDSGDSLLFPVANLQPGQAIRMSVPLFASPDAEGTDVLLAPTVTQGLNTLADPDLALSVDEATVLTLSVDEDQDPVEVGSNLLYTISYGNVGETSVTSTNLAFDLPANTSFVSSSSGGTFAAGQVTWNLGSLPAGSVGEQTVLVSVAPSLSNGALLSANSSISGINNSLPTDQGAVETAYIGTGSALSMSLAINPDPAAAGDQLDVELIISNPTGALVFGGQLLMRYPEVVVAITEDVIDGPFSAADSCDSVSSQFNCDNNDFLNFDLGNLSPGQSIRITLPSFFPSSAAAGSLSRWVAILRDDVGLDTTETVTLPVENERLIELTIDEDSDPAIAGGQISYTLSYGNQSSATITNSSLSFSLPENSSFVSASSSAEFADGVVTWNLASLPSGSVAQQTVLVGVDSTAVEGILLEATAELEGVSSSLPTVQRAAETAYVGSGSPLEVSVSVAPDPVTVGDQVRVEMIVTNPSDALVFGGSLRLRYPGVVSSISEDLIDGPFDALASCADVSSQFNCDVNDFLIWPLGNVAPGQVVRITFITSVPNAATSGQLFTLEALLNDDAGFLSTESVSVPVTGSRALSLSIDEARDPVPAGENLVYALRYGNFSETSVTNSQLIFELPEGTTLVSATGAPEQIEGQLIWELNSLIPESVAEQLVVVAIADDAGNGQLLESAAELSGTVASLTIVQRAVEADFVGSGSDLALTLELTPDPVVPGEPLNVEMVVTNPTNDLVLGGMVALRYPAQVSSVSEELILGPFDLDSCAAVSSQFNCDSGDTLFWNLGNVAPAQSIVLTVPTGISASALQGDAVTWEPVLTDDSGAVTTLATTLQFGEILPGGPLGSAILPVSRSVQVGQTATAFATLINSGTNPALGCTIAPVGNFPITFGFQATDPATNASIGTANAPVDIAGGGAQSFVFSITPDAVVAPVDIPLNFDCSNTDPAPIFTSLNTILFSAESSPIPDVIGLTTTTDLIAAVDTPTAFAVGSANVGATGDIVVSVSTGDQQLPLELSLCLTDAQTGACTSPIGPSAEFNYVGPSTASIAVFVTSTGNVTNNPAVNRIFIQFTDANGVVRGATSTAVRTQ